MSAASDSTMEQPAYRRSGSWPWGGCRSGWGQGARWSGFNIATMVVGFVFFWPVGLVILFWILSGRDARELPGAVARLWSATFGERDGFGFTRSDNTVFDAFQQTQHDRIRELKEEIRERSRRFREFRSEARRRADEEEFSRFMASAPERSDP